MSKRAIIQRVDPPAAIPGGEVSIEWKGLDTDPNQPLRVLFADVKAHLVAASRARALTLVPGLEEHGQISVSIQRGSQSTSTSAIVLGRKLAADIHPVANPVFDPADNSLFVTRSGSRGEHVEVSIYRIRADGEIEEFSGDIMNPTAIAFNPRGQMFVTSRYDGTVYRVSPFKEVSVFASDLGIATGLAFNEEGEMFVGDRSGTIFRVDEIGQASPWAQHEPSVSAYHLAFGPDGALYVTGPTVSSFDAVTRFDNDGMAEIFYRGLGRPQGLAFDRDGNLYVAASLRGRRGIVKVPPDAGKAEIVVAGMNIVGLAFSGNGEMIVATNDALYGLPLGIYGSLI